MTIKCGMRPVHPGEILREDYLVPLEMSANALSKAPHVPAPRINDIVREGVDPGSTCRQTMSCARPRSKTPSASNKKSSQRPTT